MNYNLSVQVEFTFEADNEADAKQRLLALNFGELNKEFNNDINFRPNMKRNGLLYWGFKKILSIRQRNKQCQKEKVMKTVLTK